VKEYKEHKERAAMVFLPLPCTETAAEATLAVSDAAPFHSTGRWLPGRGPTVPF